MSVIEVPDWYRAVAITGVDDSGDPRVALLDSSGRLACVIYGAIEGITGNVTVVQDDSVREVQGSDGAALRTLAVDANGQIIMVPRGQSGNYMAVDASGFLTTNIKGDYSGTPTTIAVDENGNIIVLVKGTHEGALQTLATDADGRLLIVPYDSADVWGNTVGIGNAELSAVLSPVKRYDRRGNVIWWTGFDHGLGEMSVGAVGTGANVVLSTERRLSGPYSCKIIAGSDGTHYGQAAKLLPFPVSGLMGLEVAFAIDTGAESVEVMFFYDDGTNIIKGTLLWEEATSDLKIFNSGGTYTTVDSDKDLYTNLQTFHKMKLVLDLENQKYVRGFLDQDSYDLSAYDANVSASAIEGFFVIYFTYIGDAGDNEICYLDSVIVTQNEPE